MDNAGIEKPIKVPETPPIDDIPVALRDNPVVESQNRLKPAWLIGGLLGLGGLAFIFGMLLGAPAPNSKVISSEQTQPRPTQSSPSATETQAPVRTLLGHFAYEEAPKSDLEPISSDSRLRLRKVAAKKFQEMVGAARQSGVILVPISAFRSLKEQQHLFFDIKAERGQDAKTRAEVSAPPGYSEHHTGYALDIGDGKVPATDVNPNFEHTAAFKWLQANATHFSFEMSFPRDNPQGVSYEPWHWRYVGDQQSLETFYQAKKLGVPSPESPVRSP